jgi:hypothetical protein
MEILDESGNVKDIKNSEKGNFQIINDSNNETIDNTNIENSQYSYPYQYNNTKTSENSTNSKEENSEENNDIDINTTKMIKQKIDIKRSRFPYCIVWTPLPLISWIIPVIGHTGICGYLFINILISFFIF